MTIKSVKVDRINLHMRGISSQVAREAISGLSHQIQKQAARQGLWQSRSGINRIARIDRGPIRAEPGTTANGLRRRIAQAIVEAISPDTGNRQLE